MLSGVPRWKNYPGNSKWRVLWKVYKIWRYYWSYDKGINKMFIKLEEIDPGSESFERYPGLKSGNLEYKIPSNRGKSF